MSIVALVKEKLEKCKFLLEFQRAKVFTELKPDLEVFEEEEEEVEMKVDEFLDEFLHELFGFGLDRLSTLERTTVALWLASFGPAIRLSKQGIRINRRLFEWKEKK